jgi:hypothetical protein
MQIFAPAVTRDGQSILFAEQGPYAITAQPMHGTSQPRVLFPSTSSTLAADTARDGSVYIDQVDRPVSLLRFPATGGHAVELARYQATDFGHFILLPDGRAVWKQQIAGRNRLVVVADGKEPVALSGAADDTDFPVALAGPREIAFVLGKNRRTIGIGSIATGTIARRIPFEKGSIEMMISTPDGQTLYCTAGGAIWMQPTAGGAPARVREGNAIAMDPAGKYMAVIDVFEGRVRLLTVDLHGGEEREIPIGGNARPAPIETGAIGKDGKLLLGLQGPDSWFLDPFVIDLETDTPPRFRLTRPGITSPWLGPPMGKSWQPFRLCELRSGNFNRSPEKRRPVCGARTLCEMSHTFQKLEFQSGRCAWGYTFRLGSD